MGWDEKMMEESTMKFVFGRESVLTCLEITVATMKKGETCKIQSSPYYAFGEKGKLIKSF